MPRSQRRTEKIRRVLTARQPDLTVVMENIHDPHNVSAILRSCDAVGILRVELLYTIERFPKIGKKSSSSASKWIDRRTHTSVTACCEQLHAEGFGILATRVDAGAVSLYDLDLTAPVALVFGNEHRGVSDDVVAHADAVVRIPMVGMIESLNVSVAAAVCLYEAYRQRMLKGRYEGSSLGVAEVEKLFQEWTAR